MSKEAYAWLTDALFDPLYRAILVRAANPNGALVKVMTDNYESSRCGRLEAHGFVTSTIEGKDANGYPTRRLKVTDLAKPVFL